MKKFMLCIAVLIGLAMAIQAEDLTTKDGKVYKDVKFFLITPDGLDISYKQGNETFLTHVFFANLSEEIQKKFNYSPEKAAIYHQNLLKIHEQALKKHEQYVKEQKAKSAEILALESRIEAGAFNAVLKEYASKPDGTVAWASTQNSTVTTGHLGKVFVYGMLGLSGGEAASVIYPTGINMYGYPCYTASLEQAVQLSLQNQ